MVIPGRVRNGVVVLEGEISLPEGTEVTVVVRELPSSGPERLSDKERRRIREVMDRIAALPDEAPGDGFGGRDHDAVLYGER